jgi:DNA end-binding protein Ku
MAARATWKGYLKLSLVSCPVRLYTATTSSNRISFHMLHKETHNRVQMKPHDPELGEVSRADLVKGYEFEKDRYVVVSEDELDKIEIESTKTINIEQFVNNDEIDPLYLDTPYFLAPDGPVAEETYRVICQAMQEKGKAAIARVVLARREHPVLINVRGKGFSMFTLRAGNEVRASDDAFEDIRDDKKIDPMMLKLAEQIIEQFAAPFDAKKFDDRYQEALLDVVQAKIKGERPVFAKAPERGKVINLMDALKRSLEEASSTQKPPARSKTKDEQKAKESASAPKKAAARTPRAKKRAAG